MRQLQRFAVGSIQAGVNHEPASWGLLAALAAADESPVLFHSSCEVAPHDAAKSITGRASRHLDSWAMSRSDAISALARASAPQDTAIVEGAYDAAYDGNGPASSLDRLCEWLDLP